ncbi:MAG: flagellin FliC [Magnetococcales bacterium]|nr:flagellin FliC [Magnetococcales bacterium]
MALNINTNMTALLAVQGMDVNSKMLSKTFERLISGSRLNTSGDDPAAFAVSTRLTAKIRGSNVAIRNAQDAISVTQVADAALAETTNALQKVRDLMTSAAGAGVTAVDRAAIQAEVQGLIAEVQRIAVGTSFNGKGLLTGSYAGQRVLIGAGGDILSMTIGGTSQEALRLLFGEDTGLKLFGSTIASTNEAVSATIANIAVVDAALNSVSTVRANLGAVQNRLNSVIGGLNTLVTSTSESRARIADTDMATEAAELAKLQIKQQVGAAILSQANQTPMAVLTLLK